MGYWQDTWGETQLLTQPNHNIQSSNCMRSVPHLPKPTFHALERGIFFFKERKPELLTDQVKRGTQWRESGSGKKRKKREGFSISSSTATSGLSGLKHTSLPSSARGPFKMDHFGLFYLGGIRTHLSHAGNHRDLQISSDEAKGFTTQAAV